MKQICQLPGDAIEKKPEYEITREMVITIPKNHKPTIFAKGETDITKKDNDHILTVIMDDYGNYFYSCRRKGGKQLRLSDRHPTKAISNLIVGREYAVKIFKPVKRHRNPEEAAALTFIKAQPNCILLGAYGLSLVWPIIRDDFSKYDALLTFDDKGILWVCGIGQEDPNNFGGIPHVLKPRVSGVEDYFGISEEWDGDYHLLCFCELGI